MPKKVLDAEIVHGFQRRSNSCFSSDVETVNIRASFSYELNICMIIMHVDFRSPILVITFFFYEMEVIELHAT